MKRSHRLMTNHATSTFDLLNDDTLLNIHDFLGEKTYATFGSINRKCNQLFKNFNIPKETLLGFIPVSMLEKTCFKYCVGPAIAYGVGTYKYRVLFDWALDELKGDRHLRIIRDICATACRKGWKDIVEEVFERSDKVISKKDYLEDRFLYKTKEIEYAAAQGGNLDIMKLLHKHGCKFEYSHCFQTAAVYGNIEMLQWLDKIGCKYDMYTADDAAYNERLDVLQWLHLNGYGGSFNEETFATACETGNLEMVIWLHSVGCPWNDSAFIKTNNGEVFEWLEDNLDPM